MSLIKSALVGLLLVAASVILLFWAEGRAVKTAKSLEEGKGIVVSVDAGTVDAANDGKLVHISGDVTPQDVPRDDSFGIAAEGAVSLTRKVEMLQWKETARDVERTASDGSKTTSTVYDYEKLWSSSAIDSGAFKAASAPSNPPMPLNGQRFDIAKAMVGAFTVDGSEVAALGRQSPVMLKEESVAQAAAAVGGTLPLRLVNNQYVASADPARPQVGDLRIAFARGDVKHASVVGRQSGAALGPYTTSNGRDLFLIEAGDATAEQMFKDAIEENVILTWVIRVGGLVAMLIGFALSFSPLTGTLGRIPVVGALVRGGAGLAAVALTLLVGSVVIAAGWVFYRPLLALAILAVGIALAVATGRLGGRKPIPTSAQPARP